MPIALKEYVHTVILEKKYDYSNRLFALCESCFWTATFLMERENYECPFCHSKEIALIPIGLDEKYEYSLESKQGLQIKFSLQNREI